jgi:surfeit locus 1 family protein
VALRKRLIHVSQTLVFLFCSALFLRSIEPRFITPVHDYSKRPLQLFWIDGLALKAIAAELYTPEDLASNNETAMVTQVVEDDGDDGSNEGPLLYPLQPPVSSIGNFKTTPATHVGYAATWFGLSGAGLYMTRKLITKGRF